MSDLQQPLSSVPLKEDPEALALRSKPPRVVRFRRGLIVGIAAAAAVCLVTVSWMALEPPTLRKLVVQTSDDGPSNRTSTDTLASLPKSYADVPRLGPPLPGDLGRPIVEHERSLEQGSPAPGVAMVGRGLGEGAAPLRNETSQQAMANARTAALMVQLGSGDQRPNTDSAEGYSSTAVKPDQAEPLTAALSVGQQQMIDFAHVEGGTQSRHAFVAAPSTWMLSAGTLIPASLITGLNSDLPGMVVAQVTENVRDSASGHYVLVPQGARLIGNYDSIVAYGQRRALLVWNRIVFPNGSSIELDHMPATDSSGYAGVSDGVDSHGWQLLKGIAMSTLLGVGTQLSFGGSGSDLVRALRESMQESAAHAGDQITSRNLSVQPTIKVRPGWPIRALVNKDVLLPPWRD